MDNFMDKLAQKFNAQDVIHANAEAETAEMERLQQKVAEYERILQEMRKLNVKNAELSEKIDSILAEKANQIKIVQEEERQILTILQNLTDEQTRNMEEALAANRQSEEQSAQKELLEKAGKDLQAIEELLKKSDDFTHKESVKVYRNVQAVVVEELKKQSEELQLSQKKMSTKVTISCIMVAFTFILTVASFAGKLLELFQF